MNIIITMKTEKVEFILHDFQYWNQRLFCYGTSVDGSLKKKFISTKGFDKILVEAEEGPKFTFAKVHFSPYLCSRDKDIFRESQKIEKFNLAHHVKDVGPSEFSGMYQVCIENGIYRDDLYFETKVFDVDGFDLFKYQTDDLYYTQYQSKSHDNEFPVIIGDESQINVLGRVNIIHGVNENGEKDFFDFASLYHICDADLGFPPVNSFYSIIRASNQTGLLHIMKVGLLDFVKNEEVQQYKADCGNAYIRKMILKKNVKRKHCFRFLYEYYNLTSKLTAPRRKVTSVIQNGPKGFKKYDWVPIFTHDEMMEFKIVLFKDIFTVERKKGLSRFVSGDPSFSINGRYNYIQGNVEYDEFESNAQLIKYVKNNIGIAESIKLSKLTGIWFSETQGFSPRQIRLPVTSKGNAKVEHISIYSIPEYEEDMEFFFTKAYVNLYGLLATFAIHIPQVRNILDMNEFSQILFKQLDYSFDIFHVCRDVRRGIFKWEDDKELTDCMIEMRDALRLIEIFSKTKQDINSCWYGNANNFFQSFPDTPGDAVSETYQPIGLKGYVNSLGDK